MRIIITSLLATLLFACSNEHDEFISKSNKLCKGMTETEVVSILGQPTSSGPIAENAIPVKGSSRFAQYEHVLDQSANSKNIYIVYIDYDASGKVVNHEHSFHSELHMVQY